MRNGTVERERKFEFGDDGTLPDLGGVAGVRDVSKPIRDTLDAVYYDTPDLRLARSGATLRRREGGPDAGWHLKLPGGPDTRIEQHARLSDELPGELVELVAGIVRDGSVGPVARISTVRRRRRLLGRGGDLLAEVTDDRVNGQPTGAGSLATGWREVEVELAEHTDARVLDRLEDRLLSSGLTRSAAASKLGRVLELEPDRPAPVSRKSTAGEVVLAYLREQVTVLNQQDIQARRRAPDAVHQLRVAARRIRSALRVYGRIVDRERTRRLEHELRWLGTKLGPARDLEVLEARYRAAIEELPDEWVLGAVNTRLTRYFTPARAKADRAALRTLTSTRYYRLCDQLDELLAAPPLTPRANRKARKELPRHVDRAYRKVARRMRTMRETAPGTERDTATHQVRKAAKRLRYASELAEPALGKAAKRTRKRAKAFTKILGEFQDSVVARPPLGQLGVAAHLAGDNGFTYGLLAGQERAAARTLDRDLAAAWKGLSKPSQSR